MNDGHPTPMTSAQFCKMMKESGDEYIVRDGKVKDSEWMDGKFIAMNLPSIHSLSLTLPSLTMYSSPDSFIILQNCADVIGVG